MRHLAHANASSHFIMKVKLTSVGYSSFVAMILPIKSDDQEYFGFFKQELNCSYSVGRVILIIYHHEVSWSRMNIYYLCIHICAHLYHFILIVEFDLSHVFYNCVILGLINSFAFHTP